MCELCKSVPLFITTPFSWICTSSKDGFGRLDVLSYSIKNNNTDIHIRLIFNEHVKWMYLYSIFPHFYLPVPYSYSTKMWTIRQYLYPCRIK
jgi:hypothetical protein